MLLDTLKDKTIREVYVSDNQEFLFVNADDGILKMSLYGDCCSESWFSDIYNFDALLGKVSEAREIELPDYNVNDGRTRQEEDSAYGIELITDKGNSKIVFRNSSNGYYGGSIDRIEAVDSLPEKVTKITNDWKA